MAVRFSRPVPSITYWRLPLNISSIAWGLALEDVHASPLLVLDFARVNGLVDLILLPLNPEGLNTTATTTYFFFQGNSSISCFHML
ncbi:hypothetical protein TNCV_4984941 [Trichonephila clavipes]|nr:hypothetical protein TNCV_4984941 [Trichonephila clavipes]